jgi:predicted O-linked N-acetylglucosamine transferase (SPINDLY family)
LQPQLAAACINLGMALSAQDRIKEAAQAYRHATELSPLFAEAHEHLGSSLLDLGQLTQAVASFRRAVEVAPTRAESWNRLGSGLMTQRQFAEADACFQRAVELQPDDPTLLSNWLYLQLYRPEITLRSLAARHAQWNVRHGAAGPAKVSAQPESAVGTGTGTSSIGACENLPGRRAPIVGRPLRLGFVGADFGQHPVASFSIRTFEALPALGFEICCYSTHPRAGAQNARFRKCAAVWREVQYMPNDALATRIAADRIDVLIDLAGHSGGNRLGAFARRPAPVQATWIGNEGTTGLDAMDYLIADEHVVPSSAEPFYRERIVRLPVSYVAWDPPAVAPAVAPGPAASGAPVTFGSFNNSLKYHSGLAGLWSRVLHQVPGSQLLLQYKHLTDPTLRRALLDLFAEHGIDENRVQLRDWQPYAELLDSYRHLDVALDTFPFGGGATTCEALWMGVPVVTWPGGSRSQVRICESL